MPNSIDLEILTGIYIIGRVFIRFEDGYQRYRVIAASALLLILWRTRA